MANITGTSGSDSLTGTSSADSINGLDGDDVLAGGLGNDTLNGGAGFDAADYFDAAGPVTVNLANGTVTGADGFDILIGIEDAWGSNFSDTLTGDAGDNILRGQQGDDTLDGGAGFDIADYFEAVGPVTVNLATGTATGADGDDVLISIEDIWGSNFSDTLIGDVDHNFLLGDQGDDILAGGLGDDTLNGGDGFDAADYFDASGPVTVNLATGTAGGADGDDFLIDIEDVWGSNFSDTLTGDAGDNILRGQQGNDTLDGGAGFDVADYFEAVGPVTVNLATGTATGADGNDVLISIEDIWGSNFSDTLTGDANDNFLLGGLGNDTLNGGAGIDTAVFSSSRSSYTIGSGGTSVSGPDGTDTLSGIERLQFSDKNVAFDLGSGQAAGNTVRVIGAAFDTPYLTPQFAGIGINLFDGGNSMLEVCQLALGTGLFLSLAGSTSNEAFVNTVYENVVGVLPTDAVRDSYVGLLQGSGGTMTQAQLLELAANAGVNATNVNLVGLQQTGVEFV